jgi:predicted molibdopterin-dependent oxidoreductase YjgC
MQSFSEVSQFDMEIDGRPVRAAPGQTVASVLLGAGVTVFRHTQAGEPRGIFCGMGVCFECLVTVDDLLGQRACVTLARPGMQVRTHRSETT